VLAGATSGALGPEYGVSDPLYGNRGGTDSDPEIACGSVNCLAVWSSFSGNDPIRVARIGADGTIDGAGFAVGSGPDSRFPAIAAVGSTFLVVWMDQAHDIIGARFAGDGARLGGPFPIAMGSHWDPAVGSDGTSFFVAWRQGNDVGGVRVGADGAVGSPQTLSSAAGVQDAVAVAGGASGFLVTWEDERNASNPDIYACRVSTTGVAEGDELAIATGSHAEQLPSVATDGSGYLVLWEDDLPSRDTRVDVWGAVVPQTGGPGVARPVAAAAGYQGEPALAWNGNRYLAAWSDTRDFSPSWTDLYAARLTSSGELEGDQIVVSDAPIDQYRAAVAVLGDTFVVGWEDRRFYDPPSPDIYAARVADDGAKLDPEGALVSRETNDQVYAVLTWNGSGYLAVWAELDSHDRTGIFGGRLTVDGRRLDGPGSVISEQYGAPAVAWSGSTYLVVWSDPRNHPASGLDVFGAIVGADGRTQSEFPISVAPEGQSDPVVSWNGTTFLVVWQDSRGGPSGDDLRRRGSDIFGARVTSAGQVLDPHGLALVETSDRDFAPDLAWNGANHLLLWARFPGPPETDVPSQVVGRRLGVDGRPIGGEIPIAAGSGDHRSPQVASDGSGFLVTWMDGFGDVPIRAARLDGAGMVLDSAGFDIAASGWYPSVGWSGADYVVGWLGRSGPGFTWRGRRASADGGVVGATFDISGSASPTSHSLSSGPPGSVVAAYTRRDDSVTSGGATRAFFRLIGPEPAAQEQPALPPPPPPLPPPPSPPQPQPLRPPAQIRCVVPRLRGLTTLRARRLLAAKRCRLGRVSKAYSRKVRRGRIIGQSRRAGARLPRATRVHVVVSRGPRR
jgi:PASTA domain-containing protein